MVNMKSVTAGCTAFTILAGTVALPVNALASENGRRNTTIVLGSAALALLLAKRDKTAGIITALGAAYAYKRWNDDIAARHRYEQRYGYNYRYRQQEAYRQHEAWLQHERWVQHEQWLQRQREQQLQQERWRARQEDFNRRRDHEDNGWGRGGRYGYHVRQDSHFNRDHRDRRDGGDSHRRDH